MKAQFVHVDSSSVRLLTAGAGLPLLLLHPIGHSADVFIRNIDVLAGRHVVIAPDLPGHGFSDAIDFAGMPPQVATCRHLLSLMTELGHDRFAVLGSSYGGLVAALMALQAPGRVSHLCVVGSASTFANDGGQEQTLRAVMANATTAMRSPTLEACRQRLGNIVFDRAKVAEEVLLLQMTCYAMPDRLTAFMETIEALIASSHAHEGRAHDRLEQLCQPALVIVGRNDIRAGWQQHEQGTARMTDARCLVLDECGHLPQMEHADRFNTAVLDFLGRDSWGKK